MIVETFLKKKRRIVTRNHIKTPKLAANNN